MARLLEPLRASQCPPKRGTDRRFLRSLPDARALSPSSSVSAAISSASLYTARFRVASTHRVRDVLRLAGALGITPVPEVVCPQGSESPFTDGPYAVIHAAPMFRYKRWTRDGWRELAAALADRGLAVVATGSPDEAERSYLDDLWNGMASVRRLDGRSWPEVAALLSTARVFVGPDTSVTHLAAAKGCATVALYGPTDPRVWGPWPIGGLDVPWDAAGALQRRGNVWLVQNPLPCTPFRNEVASVGSTVSRCLENSLCGRCSAVDQALSSVRAHSPS